MTSRTDWLAFRGRIQARVCVQDELDILADDVSTVCATFDKAAKLARPAKSRKTAA